MFPTYCCVEWSGSLIVRIWVIWSISGIRVTPGIVVPIFIRIRPVASTAGIISSSAGRRVASTAGIISSTAGIGRVASTAGLLISSLVFVWRARLVSLVFLVSTRYQNVRSVCSPGKLEQQVAW